MPPHSDSTRITHPTYTATRNQNPGTPQFNHDSILKNSLIETRDVGFSPQLMGMKYLEMFAELADKAARHGILIMMACHRLNPKAWPGEGKWYDAQISERRVLESWDRLADALCGRWNVCVPEAHTQQYHYPHSPVRMYPVLSVHPWAQLRCTCAAHMCCRSLPSTYRMSRTPPRGPRIPRPTGTARRSESVTTSSSGARGG